LILRFAMQAAPQLTRPFTLYHPRNLPWHSGRSGILPVSLRITHSLPNFSTLFKIGIQAGGIFVDQSASEFFRKKFYDGDLDPDQVSEYSQTAMEKFITEVKPSFKDASGDHLVAIADRQFTHPRVGVERGYMTLSG
jgi:hypothetical protein